VLALHLPDAVEAHGNDREAKILGEQADAALERAISPVAVLFLRLRENQDAVAAVDDSPAKRKLSRNPENCGSGKTLRGR